MIQDNLQKISIYQIRDSILITNLGVGSISHEARKFFTEHILRPLPFLPDKSAGRYGDFVFMTPPSA